MSGAGIKRRLARNAANTVSSKQLSRQICST
jgi:hypothetical protein